MKISSIYIPTSQKSNQKSKRGIKWTERAKALGVILGMIFLSACYYITGVLLWVVLG